jgi:MFS family permease
LLTSAFSWRATFWILVIFAGLALVSYFVFFKETFRKERSLTYQSALTRASAEKVSISSTGLPIITTEKLGIRQTQTQKDVVEDVRHNKEPSAVSSSLDAQDSHEALGRCLPLKISNEDVKLSLREVNILGGAFLVLRQRPNFVILVTSGVCFQETRLLLGESIISCLLMRISLLELLALTFAAPPYSCGPVVIGLVLLGFGVGAVAGGVLGGRWSDSVLRQLQMEASERHANEDGHLPIRSSTPEVCEMVE